ncbi:MAG TPA: UDP-N-acetylmuramoyl-L-alanyl-D-glutamate--2,6-diaminopimelate ligase [Pirellulales bacterium]|jgi:UDP-N-acetylmuramoyl-L-alanyl-D-glutamate--2,6-diaminopimelate ligase|nr:UDP-N-acetylmuramoyl-L-alanyl-D-glutamate--2,6-diaminopimelate ligase [Pirellulales bacterium]
MSQLPISRGAVSLRELLSGAQFHGADDILVQSCASDSRDCRPGDLFVALRGTRSDGHDFVQEAISKGAQAILAEQADSTAVPACIVADAREAYGQICQALAGHPSQSMNIIGVTGTNGKTTTAHLIASVLRTAGYPTGLTSTLGYDDSADAVPAGLTTPSAPTLAHWLARMAKQECSHAVIEVSSHAIAQQRIAGLEFAQVCLTNLRRDHLDFHGTLAHYHHTKTRLFGYLSPGGLAVINADDPLCVENAPLLPNRVFTIGLQSTADLTASVVERLKSEQTFLLTAGNLTVPVRTAMIGDHHVYNCLMAAAVGLAQGIELATIVAGLEAVHHIPGRLERIECGQAFGAYVDFAHTPDALAVSLDTLREVTVGRIICVFGAGGNRDAAKRPLMGRAVESRADVVIVTTDNPRFEDPQAIAAEIFSGFERFGEARWIADRSEAIHYALSLAGPDDCVLVAGRGHEAFQQVGHDRVALDDRDLVRRYLYNLEPGSPYGALMTVGNS